MYLSRVSLRADIGSTQLPLLLRDRRGYGLHRLFWDLFSNGQADNQQRHFLFREEIASEQQVDLGKRKAAPVYYVLSSRPPVANSPLFDVDSKVYQPQLVEGDRLAFKLRVNAVVSRAGKRHDIVMDAQRIWLSQQLQVLGLDITGNKKALKTTVLDHAGDSQLNEWRTSIGSGPYAEKLESQLGRSDILEWAINTSVARRVQQWWMSKGERLGFDAACLANGEPIVSFSGYQKHPLPEKSKSAGFNSLDLSGEIIVRQVDEFKRLLFEGTGPAKAFGCGLMLIRRL